MVCQATVVIILSLKNKPKFYVIKKKQIFA